MKTINQDDLLNGWLKYHNTTVEEVVKKHPKLSKTGQWFKKYPVTKAQHDEWVKWAKKYIQKETGNSMQMVNRGWCWVHLDCAPNIKDKDNG